MHQETSIARVSLLKFNIGNRSDIFLYAEQKEISGFLSFEVKLLESAPLIYAK